MATSLNALESGDALLEVARTHMVWAGMCRDRGDETAARGHFTRAAALFETVGLTPELERIQQIVGGPNGGPN
jgi:hypothetical protein